MVNKKRISVETRERVINRGDLKSGLGGIQLQEKKIFAFIAFWTLKTHKHHWKNGAQLQ